MSLQFNNTLAPYKVCPNAQDHSKSDRQQPYVKQWATIYLKDAHERLSPQIKGYDLTIEDVYTLQQMCAYEVSYRIAFFRLSGSLIFLCVDSRYRVLEVLRIVHSGRMGRL